MNLPIQLYSVVQRSPEPVASQVDDELIILSIERGRYYGTELVGQRIWTLLVEPIRVDSLCEALMAEFNVDRTTCEQEVLAFLNQLQQERLIEVS